MDGETVGVTTKCPVCTVTEEIQVPKAGYAAWKAGAFIQDALPTLNADQREQLMTGVCKSCWDELFGEEDEN